jgi:hypothetical protein
MHAPTARGRTRTVARAFFRRGWQQSCTSSGQEESMLIALAVILAVAWLLGFSVFHVASAAIHVLIVLAVVALVVHFVQGRGVGRGAMT